MEEQTHPETGVSQELSPQQRIENLLSQPQGPADEEEKPEPQTNAEQKQQPESPADAELSPDDLDTGEQPAEQPAVDDVFEIVHDGSQVKLTREEAIKYARQGFDYTQKTQRVAEKERFLDAKFQQWQQVEQITPHVMQDLAQVTALESQLSQYQNVDWVKVATDDPMGYPALRAQFDLLERSYYAARDRYGQKQQHVTQQQAAIKAELLEREEARLPEVIPEWKDEAKRAAGKQLVAKYLQNNGIDVASAAGRYLDTAFSLATAYKAAKYDELVKAKGDKVKQLRTAPPLTRPGSASNSSAKVEKDAQLKQNLRKSGSAQDAMAVILNRMK